MVSCLHKVIGSLLVVLLIGSLNGSAANSAEPAQIVDHGEYYQVTLNYSNGATPRQIGESYGHAIRQQIPRFEKLWDSYIKEYGVNWLIYQVVLRRVRQIRKQLSPDYCAEIDGIASQLSGGRHNKFGDGKVSRDELYMLNFIGDVCRMNQCCAVSVFGEKTDGAQPICGRNLDWPDGRAHQLAQLQAVITYNYDKTSVVSIGCIGFQGLATGFNNQGVFAGVLDSGTGSRFSASKKRSYLFDLREAIQESGSLEQVAAVMSEPKRKYAFNHLIMLGDRHHSAVLENNFSGKGDNRRRALRHSDSELNAGTTWDVKDAVGAVNCFALRGNTDNHINPMDFPAVRKGAADRDINSPRWQSLKTKLTELGDHVNVDGVKSVLSFYHPESRGNIYHGDLYNSYTFQSVVFKPGTLELEVAFRPKDGSMPARPGYKKIDSGLVLLPSPAVAADAACADPNQSGRDEAPATEPHRH